MVHPEQRHFTLIQREVAGYTVLTSPEMPGLHVTGETIEIAYQELLASILAYDVNKKLAS